MSTGHRGAAPPRIVLDTNVCLDLFVFRDPAVTLLHDALRSGDVIAVTRDDCREEWRRVLAYPLLRLDEPSREARLQDYDGLMHPVAAPHAEIALPRCADPDDQKFLELAATSGARWLLTRDDALLKLARRTRREGWFEILTPNAWVAAWAVVAPAGMTVPAPRPPGEGLG